MSAYDELLLNTLNGIKTDVSVVHGIASEALAGVKVVQSEQANLKEQLHAIQHRRSRWLPMVTGLGALGASVAKLLPWLNHHKG